MHAKDGTFYGDWILANGWSEALGLGGTFVIGMLLARIFESHQGAAIILMGALAAVLLGTLLEGVLVGFAQERVIRRRLALQCRRSEWIHATAAGAAAAWLLGMIPSTVLALVHRGIEPAASSEPSRVVQYALAAAMGLALGPILGYAQRRMLRRFTVRANRWLWANALAWAIGMPLIFAGMDLVPWTERIIIVIPVVAFVCGITGLAVGAIHGKFLLSLFGEKTGKEYETWKI